jgi:hypothetical protein
MIVSLMQPYLFPYLGYFQLMAASDVFVAYDDAQYMKGGWINRNRILANGRPAWVTLPVLRDSHRAIISERRYAETSAGRGEFMQRIANAYRRAPHYATAMPLVEELMRFSAASVAGFNIHALETVARLLGVKAEIRRSSSIAKSAGVAAQDKVLAVCEAVGATTYLNPAGGRELYSRDAFEARGLRLRFIEPHLPAYGKADPFVPGLSVIDALMNAEVSAISDIVHGYRVSET